MLPRRPMFDYPSDDAGLEVLERLPVLETVGAVRGSHKFAPLTVGDLFCGAGGFSEGFVQAGFDVKWAIDNWGPAARTKRKNHPETKVIEGDILNIDPTTLERVDVLIGSPPCTFFSLSNRGGSGNKKLGMKLVYRFLYFVYVLKPRYWVMENVPQLAEHLPKRVPLRKLGLPLKGFLEIPERVVLNAADFGVPQKRRRFFCGKFPVPTPTHAKNPEKEPGREPWVTITRALAGLPNPVAKRTGVIKDSNYPGLALPIEKLSEHWHPVGLTKDDLETIKRKKQGHSFYGFMPIPEKPDQPARTICAYQAWRGREAFLVESGKNWFRHLTVRECASLQSYPISYQFWGERLQDRYALVGNSVPPGLSRAIAIQILSHEKRAFTDGPIVELDVSTMPKPITTIANKGSRGLRLSIKRRYRQHVPGCKLNSLRIDLDNEAGSPAVHPLAFNPEFKLRKHLKRWQARVHLGIGDGYRKQSVGFAKAYAEFTAGADADMVRRLHALLDLVKSMEPKIPDATTAQAIWARHSKAPGMNPLAVADKIGKNLKHRFPDRRFKKVRLKKAKIVNIVPAKGLPVQLAAGLVAIAYAAEIMNRGTVWLRANVRRAYRGPHAKLKAPLVAPELDSIRWRELIRERRA